MGVRYVPYQRLEPVPTATFGTVVSTLKTLLSSHDRGWRHIQVEHYELAPQPDPISVPATKAHVLTVVLKGTGEHQYSLDGRAKRSPIYPGNMSLLPSGIPRAANWTAPAVVSRISLSPALITAIAADLGHKHPGRAELLLQPYFRDPLIEQLLLALTGELETKGLQGNLYADTLAQTLALHLLRRHSTLSVTHSVPERGLSRTQLRLVLEFIGDHLAHDITLAELAALAGLSPAYFTRQFKLATGLPPHQYLIQRRVERARELLTGGVLSVAEVAQVVGFFDQSHLHRHFKRLFKVSPYDVLKDRKNVQG